MDKLLGLLVLLLAAADLSEGQSCTADIGFILDSSGSVGLQNWQLMLQFVQQIADQADYGQNTNRMGVVVYGNEANKEIDLNQFENVEDFKEAVGKIGYLDQSTNTASGIRVLRNELFTINNGDRPGVPNIGIVMTDGESLVDPELTIPEANLARSEGILLFAMGIGNNLKDSELQGIANDPDSDFLYYVEQFDQLVDQVDVIISAACQAASACDPRLDLSFILDSSGSIGPDNWELMKAFVGDVASSMALGPNDNQIGVVTYSNAADFNMGLNDYTNKTEMMSALNAIAWKNERTHTSAALNMLRTSMYTFSHGDRDNVSNVAVVLTDGYSNVEADQTSVEAALLKDHRNTKVFAVGIGREVDISELNAIASKPTYWYQFLIDDFSDLGSWRDFVQSRTCAPPPVNDLIVGTNCQADIGFVVDASGSVGQENWNRTITFITNFVSKLAIGPSDTQVGVVVFGTNAAVEIYLNQYSTKSELLAAISNLRYLDEETNTYAGLNLLREELFSANNGARSGIAKVAILITDGESTVNASLTIPEAEAVRNDGYSLFAIGIGSNLHVGELTAVASQPTDSFLLFAEDFQYLVDNTDAILGTACYASSELLWSCNFETSEGSSEICGLIQETSDQFDWTLMTGPTPSELTGPSAAMTGAYYLYIEASSPRVNGDIASLMLPVAADVDGWYCLRFYQHRYGFHIGALQIFTRTPERDIVRWTKWGPSTEETWQLTYTNLRMEAGDQAGIRGTRSQGYSGDIGLDSIAFSKGACPVVD